MTSAHHKRRLTKDYVQSTSRTNPITRSIVCKIEDELTSNDLDSAERFLKDKSNVGFVNNYATAAQLFRDAFGYNYDESTETCITNHIRDMVLQEASLFDESAAMKNDVLEQIHELNAHDFHLYAEYAHSKNS